MKVPASTHFTPIDLSPLFNADRASLTPELQLRESLDDSFGDQSFHGIPFKLGARDRANVVHLAGSEVRLAVTGSGITFIVFAHVVADRPVALMRDLSDFRGRIPGGGSSEGGELGTLVSEYRIDYRDGTSHVVPIRRRFAIQQAHIDWGASPFEATAWHDPTVTPTSGELKATGANRSIAFGSGETRHTAGMESAREHIWLFALGNPFPSKEIRGITCSPRDEQSVIYGVTVTGLAEHPLRPSTRRKIKVRLPDGVAFNRIGELDNVGIDMGTVISARAMLEYDAERWLGGESDVQPVGSDRDAIVELAAHPRARLYVGRVPGGSAGSGADGAGPLEMVSFDLSEDRTRTGSEEGSDGLVELAPATRPVRVRVVEKGGSSPVPVRLHLHGPSGEYLPPKGHHRKVNTGWFEDNYAEFANGLNQYCYIPGTCVADLPIGKVFIEIDRGFEITPIRTCVTVTPGTDELTFELERVLHWRERGWVSADTHVHFLSPQTALLEGAAEGVNVVNLLASQWGEMFSNVGDFDGRTTFGASSLGGKGEFLVRVGTENRMQVLGHISLLGYSGEMIQPLCSGGPSESAIGDPLEVTMAEWASRCIEQKGLVVMPHAPNPQAERAANIIMGLVHAIEMMTFNPYNAQISPYGLADWYRYLNLGYRIPVVGGSDKMTAGSLLGGIRTYAKLGGDEALTYDAWAAAVKRGNTFVTIGPLVELSVDGVPPGGTINLPGPGTVEVAWKIESARTPVERVEIVMGGQTVEEISVDGRLAASGSARVSVANPSWIALRARGGHKSGAAEIAAHSSAVQLAIGGKAPFSETDALAVLEQIEGCMAYVDTLAPRPVAERYKKLRASLESAYNRMHVRMHQQGVFHQHASAHDHREHHEHGDGHHRTRHHD